MKWKRKAYQVAAALEGTVIRWYPQSRQTFASVEVQTQDGVFLAIYSKCRYLSMSNNISSSYKGAFSVRVGIYKGATNRFEVVCNEPQMKEMKRILAAFLRLKHPAFDIQQVMECLSISHHEQMELLLELQDELKDSTLVAQP